MLQPKHFITPEEYLELEKSSPDKHEYWNGEMYMMAGTTRQHNRITINTTKALDRLLERRPYSVLAMDIRLRIQKDDLYTYPDVMVVCGKIETDPRQQDTVMNPLVIVEGLADSTQGYDKGKKFKMYRTISSLQEYAMIDQTQPYVEVYRRTGHFWVFEALEGMDAVLMLKALEVEIALAEIYAQVDWESA